MKCDGAIIVTTPQAIAIDDVIKEVSFCKKTGIPITGIVENMSGFVCPTCLVNFFAKFCKSFNEVSKIIIILQECTNIFSSDGGILLSQKAKVPFLTKIPIDPVIGKLADKGQSVVKNFPNSQVGQAFAKLAEEVTRSKEM